MHFPFVYIIVANTNGHENTIECLETVFKQSFQNFRVLLVDNSPGTESLDAIIRWCEGLTALPVTLFPELVTPPIPKPVDYRCISEDEVLTTSVQAALTIIRAKENNGFSAANNIALRFALHRDDFDWVWLLNNDTVLKADSLQHFIDRSMQLPPSVGMVGTKLFYYSYPHLLQGIGGSYNKWLAATRHVAEGEADTGQFDDGQLFDEKVEYIIAASLFVTRAFLLDVGLLCEDYFFYFEELDWAVRGKRLGWRLGFVPSCHVFHKDGSTVPNFGKAKSVLSDVAMSRNRILFTRKFFRAFTPIAYVSIIRVAASCIKSGRFRRLRWIVTAVAKNQYPKRFVGVHD